MLDQFTRGLADAGHASEVVDVYAITFNPVYSLDDYSFFAHEPVPQALFDEAEMREGIVAASGGLIRPRIARRWLAGKNRDYLLQIAAKQRPKDVLAQQERVARADGLAFIAAIIWMNFPEILRGWVDRVFTYP